MRSEGGLLAHVPLGGTEWRQKGLWGLNTRLPRAWFSRYSPSMHLGLSVPLTPKRIFPRSVTRLFVLQVKI